MCQEIENRPLQKIASLTMLDECAKSLPRKCAATALTVTLSTFFPFPLTVEGKLRQRSIVIEE